MGAGSDAGLDAVSEPNPERALTFEQSVGLIRERYSEAIELLGDDVADLDEVAADDAFLDILGCADPETLTLLGELGGPLSAMLAAWALGVRED